MKSKKIKGLVLTGKLKNDGILETTEGNSLNKWYEKLDCEVIDIVSRKIGGKTFEIVCDDMGRYNKSKQIMAFSKSNPFGDYIVGSIAIYGGVDFEGNLKSVTDEDIEIITKHIMFTDDNSYYLVMD